MIRREFAVFCFALALGVTGCKKESGQTNNNNNNPPVCGDGVVEGMEVCDGSAIGASCASQGFSGGTLTCLMDCSGYDTSGCRNNCGNGVLDAGEVCDGTDFDGEDCVTQGFDGGTLACNANCNGLVTTGCTDNCGNGVVDAGEVCDGTDFNGVDCAAQGFIDGNLACNATCDGFDASACNGTGCGDNVQDFGNGESCDGTDLGGLDCTTIAGGFDGGTLACDAFCDYDTSQCFTSVCGDGVTEGAEVCDDGNTTDGDGCSANCLSDETCGNGICDIITGECATCTGDCPTCPPECRDGIDNDGDGSVDWPDDPECQNRNDNDESA